MAVPKEPPTSCWALDSVTYVKEAVQVTEGLMKEHNLTYTYTQRRGMNTPFSNQDYHPELDSTDLCGP